MGPSHQFEDIILTPACYWFIVTHLQRKKGGRGKRSHAGLKLSRLESQRQPLLRLQLRHPLRPLARCLGAVNHAIEGITDGSLHRQSDIWFSARTYMYIYSQSVLLPSCNSTIAHRLVNRIDGSVSSLTISFVPDCTEQGHIFVQCCCAVATNPNSLNECVYFTPLSGLPRFFLP